MLSERADNGKDVPKVWQLGRKVRTDERCPKIDVLEDLGDHCSETEVLRPRTLSARIPHLATSLGEVHGRRT